MRQFSAASLVSIDALVGAIHDGDESVSLALMYHANLKVLLVVWVIECIIVGV